MTERSKISQGMADTPDTAAQAPAARGSGGPDPVLTVDPAATARVAARAPADGERGNESPGEQQAPPSPCVSVCALDENDLCMGCYRTASEITDWFMASPTEKHAILRAAEERRRADSPIRLL